MNKIVFILPILFIVYACEKEMSDNEDQISNYTLVAGEVIHDSIIYYKFDPYISVKGPQIGVDTNYIYHDSVWIDLENDGINDLYFEFYRYHFEPSCDCEGIDCCMPVDELEIKFKTGTNIEIASRDFYGSRPERFSTGDSIDNRCDWQKFTRKSNFILTGETNDKWWIDDFNSFLAIRFPSSTDTIYGWVRINTHCAGPIEIYDYAIVK